MPKSFKHAIKILLGGEQADARDDKTKFPDMDEEFFRLYEKCKGATMTSIERMYALYMSVKYVVASGVPGDFVECGVWKGGSAMLIALALKQLGVKNRKLYLYDTYDGMTAPSDEDVDVSGAKAGELLARSDKRQDNSVWCYSSIEEVKNNLSLTGFDENNMVFVKGDILSTVPEIVPEAVSLLRLDTDWFASTYHEMKHFYPLLSRNGVLIIDDYGHWAGSKKAVDLYAKENNLRILLNRIDYTGRIAVKN